MPDLPLVVLATDAALRAAQYLEREAPPVDPAAWSTKGFNDYVTACDRHAEELIAEVLLRAEPRSRVVGEELTPELSERGLVWIVDPIDGTTNFVHRFPVFAVSVAAAVDGVLEAGVVVHVERGLVYRAGRGAGAWLARGRQASEPIERGAPLSVSRITDPAHALVGTGFPFKHLDRMEEYQRQLAGVLARTSGVRRAGSAALDLAWVAAGHFDGFWELALAPWDIAAGMLLIREAGGVVTDLTGRDVGPAHTGLVAGNPAIHRWLIEELNGERGTGTGKGERGKGKGEGMVRRPGSGSGGPAS